MELFGIGPLELLFIILIAVIVLGPKDIEKTAKAVGRGLYRLVRSDTWKTLTQTSRRIRTLPNELMRQAGIEELQKDLNKEVRGSPGSGQGAPPGTGAVPTDQTPPIPEPPPPENRISPPGKDQDPPG